MPKNLVFSAVGDGSMHKTWTKGKKNYDIMLVYFGDNEKTAEKYEKDAKYFFRKKSPSKFLLLKECLEESPDIFNNYEYIWAPDDDISSSSQDINNLFKVMKEYDLWLGQPGITGFASHRETRLQAGKVLRHTNFVEVMAPCFSLEKLLFLYPTFEESVSAWGLDFLWPALLGCPEDKIAIIDESSAEHTKPVAGNYSRFEVHPKRELEAIKQKYHELFEKTDNYRKVKTFNIIDKKE